MNKFLTLIAALLMMNAVYCQNGKNSNIETRKNLTIEEFKKISIDSKKYVYFNFTAEWCVVCKRQAPMLEIFAEANKDMVDVITLDMKENPLIAEYFEVDGLPINLFYKNGLLIWNRMGLQTAEQLTEVLKKFKK